MMHTIYRLALAGVGLAIATSAAAQDPAGKPDDGKPRKAVPMSRMQPPQPAETDPAKLRDRLEKKLTEPFATSVKWILDYDRAKLAAKTDDKLIFGYFTRSYAHCAPCKALEHGTLTTPAFATFTKDVVPFLHVTSNLRGRKHDNLLRTLVAHPMFPTLLILGPDGEVITQPRERTVVAWCKAVVASRTFLELRKEPATDPLVRKRLFFVEAELGRLDFDGAKARAKTLGELSDDERARVTRILADLEFDALLHQWKSIGMAEFVRRGRAMLDAGREPSRERVRKLWASAMQHAAKTKDAVSYSAALAAYEGTIRNDERERMRATVERLRARLDKLRE